MARANTKAVAVKGGRDTGGARYQTAGYTNVGARVCYILPEGSPNAGKVRFADVTRRHINEERGPGGSYPDACDLIVGVLSEDGVEPEQLAVPRTSVGARLPGTWDYIHVEASGF